MTTIIGAGFASGQEIMQFFAIYDIGGFYGIILSGILFSVIGYIVLDKVYTERIKGYNEFLFPTVGQFLGHIMEFIITFFMLAVFCIMVAGISSIMYESFSLPFGIGVIITATLCFFIMLGDMRGIVFISSIITPILIIGIVYVGIFIVLEKDVSVFNSAVSIKTITDNWFVSSLSYVGYNSLISVVILCSLLPYLNSRKTAVIGGIFGGVFLGGIAVLLNFVIYLFIPEVLSMEVPILGILSKFDNKLGGFYTIILILAMFTSAITSGHCFIERIILKTNFKRWVIAGGVCIISVLLSRFGFATLIGKIYPLFGYMGIFMMFIILLNGVKKILPYQIKK